jgi:hypothetical protein
MIRYGSVRRGRQGWARLGLVLVAWQTRRGQDWRDQDRQTRRVKERLGKNRQTWYGADGSGLVGRVMAELAGTGTVRNGKARQTRKGLDRLGMTR